jgi:hypothetical protein
MEILLIAACAWLVHTAGVQSEQARLGVSPAQRDIMREQTRHEKAVRRIGEKHGGRATPTVNGTSPWKNPPGADPKTAAPESFWSGYRSQRPSRPPFGHRAGTWAGNGVSWAQDTGRDAWRAYRKRRKDAGHDDPSLIVAPIAPQDVPVVPPIPAQPPTVGIDAGKRAGPAEPEQTEAKKPAEPPKEKQGADLTKAPEPAPATPAEEPKAAPDSTDEPTAIVTAEPATAQPDTTPAEPQPADTPQGVGRMAAEVTYDSVMDESDELSAMCEDDLHTYDRIKSRAEREVSRGDTLASQVLSTGFGATIHAIVVRCREQYQIIHDAIDDLKANTVAQDEAVTVAKDTLQKGQGVYADIAKDMEDVAEREAYISDRVDAEDTNPEAEHYETKAA